ncbi:MAG TPA: Abi family protein [Kofleriaceae bacterium]|nr:Abi family protein [Kofleriaceae bacterium]
MLPGRLTSDEVDRTWTARSGRYRLSAYWYTFRTPGTEILRPGTTFDEVWDRYVFDQQLRVLVMEAIESIEVTARTQLAYHHAHAFDPFAYASNPTSLPNMTNGGAGDPRSHAHWIRNVRKQIGRSGDHPFVRAYRAKYTSSADLPIWMATELMTLGNVLSMYQGRRIQERQPVATIFGVTITELESWLMMLHNVRNICAHHGRFWNRKLAKRPKIPSGWHQPVAIDNTTVFAALTVCAYCLTKVAPASDWHAQVRRLIERYPKIPKRTATGWTMGLPDNWFDCPIWSPARWMIR